jgi:NitT/TauT family transport system permease protein
MKKIRINEGKGYLGQIRNYILSVIIFLVAWEILAESTTRFHLMPTPYETALALARLASTGILFENIKASLFRVLSGFTIAFSVAVPLGFLIGWYKTVKELSDPIINLFRVTPPLAFIPLMIIYFGIGELSKIMVITYAAFFVLVVIVYQAVRNVDAVLIKAARVLGAKDRDLFFHVVVPHSVPYIIAGCRVAIGSSWMSVVASELIAAQSGLGYMIEDALRYFDIDVIVGGIIVIGIIGLIMDGIVRYIERRVTVWMVRVS